jgi:hypothetical protein
MITAKRACACVLNARTCMYSLISERILSKFAGDILWLTLSGKDYVLYIFTHCASACVSGRVVKSFTNLWMDSLQIWWAYTTNDHTSHGIHTYHVHAPRARARARVRARAWLTVRLCMDGFSSNLRWTYYRSQQVARVTYLLCSRTAHTRARVSVQSRAWLNIQLSLDGLS